MFSNVIVDIAFPRRSFVFSQSSCEVSASLTDIGGVAVGTIDLIYCSLSLMLVSNRRSVIIGSWATWILNGCSMREMFSDMPFMYGIVAAVVGVALSLSSVVVVGLWVSRWMKSSSYEDFIRRNTHRPTSATEANDMTWRWVLRWMKDWLVDWYKPTKYIQLTTTFHLTLMMTSAQVVEKSVVITGNSPSQDYTHRDDQTTLLHVTPGFKQFTEFYFYSVWPQVAQAHVSRKSQRLIHERVTRCVTQC